MSILMCRPEFFGIEYEINPWMHVEAQVDRRRALEQWDGLLATYQALGETVELVEPVPGLPDLVFTANAAVLWNRRAVLSRFRHSERQGEEVHFQRALERLGIEVFLPPQELAFEGAGDALFVGNRMYTGWGFRTDVESHRWVGDRLGVEVVSLHLVDDRFYHLDTCFSPLDDHTAIFYPGGFAPESAERIRQTVPNAIEVPESVAAGFACNAMTLAGRVVSSLTVTDLRGPLAAAGYEPLALPMNEFMKSGGGVRCLSLPLEVGVGAA